MNNQTTSSPGGMKKCKQCFTDMPSKAKTCPNCKGDQRSWVNRHPFFTIFLFFMFIGFLGMLGGGESSETSSVVAPPVQPVQTSTPSPAPVVSDASKAEAQKELNENMRLAKAANLVTSYEFSDKASVVYIGPIWYTQPVSFKKDFLAGTARLKKIITGFGHFEVRDGNSNEKVAEVTSFTQSLEVYK